MKTLLISIEIACLCGCQHYPSPRGIGELDDPNGTGWRELSEDEKRLNRAIYKLLGYYVDWDGPFTLNQIERMDGNGSFMQVDADAEDWQKFRDRVQMGDEIYFTETEDEIWVRLAGRAGYVLIRGRKGVAYYPTGWN